MGDIDYGNLMHAAMRGLIRQVLQAVAMDGLPGDHHFFVTFSTQAEGVEIAEWLEQRYPQEMTIVIQHWFENLEVTEDGFGVTLNFGDHPEHLVVPYDSIRTFVDPSVEFGLRFESLSDEDEDEEELDAELAEVEEEPHADAEIVSLDKFRK